MGRKRDNPVLWDTAGSDRWANIFAVLSAASTCAIGGLTWRHGDVLDGVLTMIAGLTTGAGIYFANKAARIRDNREATTARWSSEDRARRPD